jgi:hypothetical protein
MARSFNGANGDKAITSGSPVSAYGFSFAAWVNTSGTTQKAVLQVANTANSQRVVLALGAASQRVAQLVNDQGNTVTSAGQWTDNTWLHVAGKVTGTGVGQASVVLNGVETVGQFATARSGFNVIGVGARFGGGSWASFLTGSVAKPCLWNAGLTSDEFAQLAAGVHPELIRPEAIVWLPELWAVESPEPDHWGGYPLTLTGTAPADDPPLIYAAEPLALMDAAPATGNRRRRALACGAI